MTHHGPGLSGHHPEDEHQLRTYPQLVARSDSELELADRGQDVRGLCALDQSGEEIGSVEDLYVDPQEREVCFLDVSVGGFLGIREKHFLVPVEAVAEVREDGVVVDQYREKVAGSPPFDARVVPQPTYQRDIYEYYGFGRAGGRADPGAWPGGI